MGSQKDRKKKRGKKRKEKEKLCALFYCSFPTSLLDSHPLLGGPHY